MLHISCTQLLTSSGTCSVTDMTFTQLTCRMGHPMMMSIIYLVYRLVKFSILFSQKLPTPIETIPVPTKNLD